MCACSVQLAIAWSIPSLTTTSGNLSPISTKPWFLTFDPANDDVLIWKNNCRLRVSENEGCGRVTDVAVLDEAAGLLLVCFMCFSY